MREILSMGEEFYFGDFGEFSIGVDKKEYPMAQ